MSMASYPLRTLDEARMWVEPLIPTTLLGFALSGMSREMWKLYPFDVYGPQHGGWGSDYNLSYRLGQDGIPIVAPRVAEIRHLKEQVNHLDKEFDKRILVGEITPCVSWHSYRPRVGALNG